MIGKGACCAGCANGNGCEGPKPIQEWSGEEGVPVPAAFAGLDQSSGPVEGLTLLSASIDCRTKDYDERTPKELKLV